MHTHAHQHTQVWSWGWGGAGAETEGPWRHVALERWGWVGPLSPVHTALLHFCVWCCLNTSAHGQGQVAEEDTLDPPTLSFTDIWDTQAMGKLHSEACRLLL